MIKRKKSRFWTFCFSFMPGAAEMYMGFMKMGLSLMGIFMSILFVTALIDCGPILFVAVIAWFYSFFHARNLAGMSEEELNELEDVYLLNFSEDTANSLKNKLINQKIIAYALIGIGAYCLWKGFFRCVYMLLATLGFEGFWGVEDTLSRLVIGLAVIYAGIYLIRGKKKELYGEDQTEEEETGKNVEMIEDKEESSDGAEQERKNA